VGANPTEGIVQTPSRKSSRPIKVRPVISCNGCGDAIGYTSLHGRCLRCRSIPIPPNLAELVWLEPATTLAARLGISDKMISKWCKKLGISRPGPGHWAKKAAGKV
jgi:hypothetical protein